MPDRRVKTYVELDARVDERGVVTPKLITMPDAGRYPVDAVVGTSERVCHGRQGPKKPSSAPRRRGRGRNRPRTMVLT